MSADSDNLRATFSDQLSSFEDRLAGKEDEVQMLAEIREAIGRLLEANDGSEEEIRRVLQERFDSGELRKETFQLVRSMLDRYVTEQVPTSNNQALRQQATRSSAVGDLDDPANDDPFSSTDVIATDVFEAEDPDDRVQVGSVLRDRFVLQERVSGGSMGVVYKALDRRLAEAGSQEPWVAIKVLSPQLARNGTALRALQQEAAKSRCLTHPNIVRFIDFDRDEDLYYIVMEWLDGRTLADILDSPDSRKVDIATSFRIVQQIGKALEYAHRCGIVHADVKPGNIMILPNGDARLFDFGVARVQQRQRVDADEFDPAVLGALTPAYSSMQVLTGEDPVPSDDVFSLACLLYRLVAGYRVYGPRNAAEAAEAGMAPQRLAGVSDEQWSAIRKALSFARVTRYDSMAEFLAALGYRPTHSAVAPDVSQHVEFEDGGGSFKWVVALVALLSLLGVAGYQFGIVDEVLHRLNLPSAATRPVPPPREDVIRPAPGAEDIVEGSSVRDADMAAATPANESEAPLESEEEGLAVPARGGALVGATPATTVSEATGVPQAAAEAAIELIDLTELAMPDLEIIIDPDSFTAQSSSVTLREDGRSVIVDLIRREPLEEQLTLRLDEVGFSGNRSPWRSGQFEISNGGYVEFPRDEDRARVTLAMASDTRREADQVSTLRVREVESAAIALATIELVLEDDDQRRFEAELPANTVAFAVSQVSVRERDPAVQIDLVRFNPDDTRLIVNTEVLDITATAGEDFFPPGNGYVVFGPGQRSARLLIPLVQDVEAEGDEAFVVELTTENPTEEEGVHNRVAVMIRDDD
jgi:serine/threonine protein kinase